MKIKGLGISKELVAFAYVQEEYTRTGDITAGLMPIFAPIIHEWSGQIFDASRFAKAVQSRYGIAMRPITARGLIPKLVEVGFLTQEKQKGYTAIYRCAAGPDLGQPRTEDGIEELLNDFCIFAKGPLSLQHLEISDSMLTDRFLERLMEMQFLRDLDGDSESGQVSSSGSNNDRIIDENGEVQLKLAIDVLSAEFITTLAKNDPSRFSFLERMVSGAMIADVVLTLQQPTDTDLSGLTVVLDGPLIMDKLDLNTPEHTEYAADLLDLLRKANVKLVTYAHVVEEIHGSIYAPLSAHLRGEPTFGPLAARFQINPTHVTYARIVCDELDNFIQNLDIEVVDAKDLMSVDYQPYCPEEIEDSIRNALGPVHEKVDRRTRDAKSITSVMRMRKGYRAKTSVTESKYVFVTRSVAVAYRANNCLFAKKVIDIDDVPPCIMDLQLACILWLCLGGSEEKLTRGKLLANCMDALYPRPDLLSSVRKFLERISSEKAKMFEMLMKDKRAQRCLIHKTLGYALAVSQDNAEELLEEMRRSTAEEVKQEAQQKEIALREEHARQVAMQTDELNRVRNDAERLQREATKLQQDKELLIAKQDEVVQTALERACRSARTVERTRKALILAFYGCAVVAVTYYSNRLGGLLLPAICGALAILGVWFVPDNLLKPWIDRGWQKKFNSEIKASNMEDYEIRFQINRGSCSVQKIDL